MFYVKNFNWLINNEFFIIWKDMEKSHENSFEVFSYWNNLGMEK